jgi:hypothetical protein
MDDHERRVRAHAESLWKDAGSPQGGPERYRGRAEELAAIEENQGATLRPLREGEDIGAAGDPELPADVAGPTGEPVEPTLAVENEGEFPTMTDQGEGQPVPTWPEQEKRPKGKR